MPDYTTGHAGLHDLLSNPELGRLKQRVRQRLSTEALSAPEVLGYLKHALREAGGDYDAIFDANVADIVFGCSEGIPRVINSLCETALMTAMEENSVRVTAALMSQVALDAFGYDATSAVAVAPSTDTNDEIGWEEPLKPEANTNQPDPEAVAERPAIGHDLVVESGCYPIPVQAEPPQSAEEPVAPAPEAAEEMEEATDDTNEIRIPELINDTQPELPELASALAARELDIPVLDTQSDDTDIESTQTLAQPAGLDIDEAVSSGSVTADSPQDSIRKSDEHFDLDAALSPDVESTNVMPGITPNLDAIASEKTEPTVVQQIIEPSPAPEPQAKEKAEPVTAEVPAELDLPTLSDSMRVDIDEEVKRANDHVAKTEESESTIESVTPAPVATEPPPVAEEPAPPDVEAPTPVAAKPPQVVEEPAPVAAIPPQAVEEPAPVAAKPPQVVEEPTPLVEEPAPVAAEPTPLVEEPAPTAKPAPVAEKPAAVAAAPTPVTRKPAPAITDATMNAPAMRDPIGKADSADRQSDIDALEAALAAAKNGELATQAEDQPVNGTVSELQTEDAAPAVPEITLDQVIANQQTQLEKLDQFRDEIDNVNSLEDVSDVMAETLFGVEFEEIAAAAIANPPSNGTDAQSEPESSPVSLSGDEIPAAANDAEELKLDTPESVETKETEPEDDEALALNDSAALRIDLLNEMKAKAAAMSENIEMGSDAPADKIQLPKGPQPEPIERQINTSMTQTLEALNVTKAADAIATQEEPKEEKKSGGLFARFRKSS
jgi:hypothetical protein